MDASHLNGFFQKLKFSPIKHHENRCLSIPSDVCRYPRPRISSEVQSTKEKLTSHMTNKSTEVREIKPCDVCFEKPKDAIFLPCCHISCCYSCGKNIMLKRFKCIICNQTIVSTNKVYIT
jgi:hypothetical protein